MNLRNFFAVLPLLALPACTTFHPLPDAKPGENAAHFEQNAGTNHFALDYLVYLPPNAVKAAKREWPGIIFLHGSGERGTNVWDVTKHGPPKILKNETDFKFVVISPQCPPGKRWDVDEVTAFIKEMRHRYPIDPDRLYLTGLSMGGSGTWNMLLAHPGMFAAAVPICGRTDTNALAHLPAEKLEKLKRVPIHIFHGEKDPTVPVANSKEMAAALKACGANVELTVYPEAVHDSWTQTYDKPELYTWMLSHNRKTNH